MTPNQSDSCTISFTTGRGKIAVPRGARIFDSLKEQPGIDSPCGGKGKCGKCRIRVLEGEVSEVKKQEYRVFTDQEIAQGFRLSCLTRIQGDLLLGESQTAKVAEIESVQADFSGAIDPPIKKTALSELSLDDAQSDFRKVCDALGLDDPQIDLPLLSCLPSVLRDSSGPLTVVYCKERIISIEAGDSADKAFSVAVDIGTTTIAAYLLDSRSGSILERESALNCQRPFGADVLTRIAATIDQGDGLKKLHTMIVGQIMEIIAAMAGRRGISSRHIHSLCIVGNTTMTHLLLGVPPQSIARAPYAPVFTQMISMPASRSGFTELPFCQLIVLPGISAYVGADIVAGILAAGLRKSDQSALFIDIGTNGEVILSDKGELRSCSTAAGPAFEGYSISCGVGGISGAVSRVQITADSLAVTTIHDKPAVGICGSGIIDCVAVLRKAGLLDSSGRLLSAQEVQNPLGRSFLNRRTQINGSEAFIVVFGEDAEDGKPVYFTQKDVREVQMAKAGIAAGILALAAEFRIDLNTVDKIIVAGGFGSHINTDHIFDIQLIPPQLKGKPVTVAGNTAGQGAIACSLSREALEESVVAAQKTQYFELSGKTSFNDKYMELMSFGED